MGGGGGIFLGSVSYQDGLSIYQLNQHEIVKLIC